MEKFQENLSEELRTTKGECRERADIIRSRLFMLSGEDKLLMTMYWENGISIRQISRLAGISRSNLDRRIHKLTKRLMKGKYIACLRNNNRFNKTEMAIAKDYFLRGIAMKKIAKKREISYYYVRNTLRKIHKLLDLASNVSYHGELDNYGNC